MKQKMSVKEQVALLTLEQKKNIRIYELIEVAVTLVCIVPLLVAFLNSFFKYMRIMDSNVSFFVKQEANEVFRGTLIVYFLIIAVLAVLFTVIFFAVVKKKMTYYSSKKAIYLLTHKD